MRLIKLLWRESWQQLALSIACSLATALLMLALLAQVSKHLAEPGSSAVTWWQFLLLATVTCLLQILANVFINLLARRTIQRLRSGLVERIVGAPLATFEQTGTPKVLASLIEDADRIADATPEVVAFVRDMAFMLACFGYLGWLSYKMLAIVLVIVAVGALLHKPLQVRGVFHLEALRTREQLLLGALKTVVDGFKQIKLSPARRTDVLANVAEGQAEISRLNAKSLLSFTFANAYAVLLFLVLICITMFGGFGVFADREALMAYTLTLIFLLGPIQNITGSAQQLGRAAVALGRIWELDESLRVATREVATPIEHAPAASWRRLVLEGVTRRYSTAERHQFEVGPVHLSLHRGEVLFVAGGNGSGKTTFGKVISGLYTPDGGRITVDGTVIDDTNREWYRQQFGAVFADFSLFEGLVGTQADERLAQHADLIRLLQLDHVIEPSRGLFAQAATFSSGERRRVALLLTCLDDKQAYLFDEFAADQDAECKELFYNEILPRLRAMNKLVIVITHDARYFDCADSTLLLERDAPPVVRKERADARRAVTSS